MQIARKLPPVEGTPEQHSLMVDVDEGEAMVPSPTLAGASVQMENEELLRTVLGLERMLAASQDEGYALRSELGRAMDAHAEEVAALRGEVERLSCGQTEEVAALRSELERASATASREVGQLRGELEKAALTREELEALHRGEAQSDVRALILTAEGQSLRREVEEAKREAEEAKREARGGVEDVLEARREAEEAREAVLDVEEMMQQAGDKARRDIQGLEAELSVMRVSFP